MSDWAIAKRTVIPRSYGSRPNVIGGKIYRVAKIKENGQISVFCEDGDVRCDAESDLRLLSPLELLARQVEDE